MLKPAARGYIRLGIVLAGLGQKIKEVVRGANKTVGHDRATTDDQERQICRTCLF